MRALTGAFAGGAMPRLRQLYLAQNPIGDEGKKALAVAIASGALANLAGLVVPTNQSYTGVAGVLAFVEEAGPLTIPAMPTYFSASSSGRSPVLPSLERKPSVDEKLRS